MLNLHYDTHTRISAKQKQRYIRKAVPNATFTLHPIGARNSSSLVKPTDGDTLEDAKQMEQTVGAMTPQLELDEDKTHVGNERVVQLPAQLTSEPQIAQHHK